MKETESGYVHETKDFLITGAKPPIKRGQNSRRRKCDTILHSVVPDLIFKKITKGTL